MLLFNFYRAVTKNTNLLYHAPNKYFSKSSCLFECGENVRKALFVPVQTEKPKKPRRVTIVGAGGVVGITSAYNLVSKHLCDELILLDIPARREVLCGEALDLLHGSAFFQHPKIKITVSPKLTENSDLIIVACGVRRKPGQSRNDVVQTNVDIIKEAIPPLTELSPGAVILVLANPADIIAYAVWKYSCFDKNRVVGAGTEIDTARLRYFSSKRLGINPYCIETDQILEHGDTSVPLWSIAHVAGTRLRDLDKYVGTCADPNNWNDIFCDVQDAGGKLNSLKGWTNWNIGVVAGDISQDILQDNRIIHHIALCAKGHLNIETDCFMTFPAVLGNRGIHEIVAQVYDQDELVAIQNGVSKINAVFQKIKF